MTVFYKVFTAVILKYYKTLAVLRGVFWLTKYSRSAIIIT